MTTVFENFVNNIVERQKRVAPLGKSVRISFGEDVPSFVLSDIALSPDLKLNDSLVELNKKILQGCIDCGKLSTETPSLFDAARFLDFYGLLMIAEEDLGRFTEVPSDLRSRRPSILLEDLTVPYAGRTRRTFGEWNKSEAPEKCDSGKNQTEEKSPAQEISYTASLLPKVSEDAVRDILARQRELSGIWGPGLKDENRNLAVYIGKMVSEASSAEEAGAALICTVGLYWLLKTEGARMMNAGGDPKLKAAMDIKKSLYTPEGLPVVSEAALRSLSEQLVLGGEDLFSDWEEELARENPNVFGYLKQATKDLQPLEARLSFLDGAGLYRLLKIQSSLNAAQ